MYLYTKTSGKLRVNSANSKFPPTNAEIEAVFGTKPMVLGTFLAGDDRVNEMPGLLVMHTCKSIFV